MKKFLIFTAICLGFSYQSYAEINDDGQRSLMMLRLRPTNTDTDEAWSETYKIIKENPGCCDEVWFSTGMGFLPREWHEDKAARIGRAMVQLKEIGIGSSLQFQMTIGHGDKFGVGNEHLYAEKTWRGWTGSQGVEAKYSSCPRSPFVGLVIPRVSADGNLRTVGVVNTRIDSQEEIRIRLAGVPEKAKVTWHELKKKPLRCRVESVDGQTYVMIPQIAAWNAGFLEIK